MGDAREVYQSRPDDYDALVRCEDREGNLLPAIRQLVELDAADVVELGAGTGRLTTLLAPHVRTLRAFDIAEPMLEVARQRLARIGATSVTLGVADNASLPVSDASADLAIAGWTHGHQTVWNAGEWRAPIERALGEMTRVVRQAGTLIVIETLGTGHTSPFEPPDALGRYYAMLEQELGFSRTWLRTDYEFPSLGEGERLVRSFFGDARADAFAAGGSRVLPECTGIWWKRR